MNALQKLMNPPDDWEPPTPEQTKERRLATAEGRLIGQQEQLCATAAPGQYGAH